MTKAPSPKSIYKLKHLFNLLGLRIIPGYFYEKNKELFQQWQYNACNQTALIVGCTLRKLIDSPGINNPFLKSGFLVQLHEGIFTEDHMPGQYNHAYVYAKEVINEDERQLQLHEAYCFFIDVARISNPTIFQAGYGLSDLPVSYSSNYQMCSTKQLSFADMLLTQKEYYTNKYGLEIFNDIERILKKLGYDLDNFDWNMQ